MKRYYAIQMLAFTPTYKKHTFDVYYQVNEQD